MYHIPNDKRCKETAYKIYVAVRHLMLEKPLIEITVMDIKEKSGISRSTFYRLFDNVTDPLRFYLEKFIDESIELSNKSDNKLLAFFEYFNRHSDIVYLVSNQSEYIFKEIFLTKYKESMDTFTDYLITVKISVLTSIISKWVTRGKKETPKEMEEITRKILSMDVSELIADF